MGHYRSEMWCNDCGQNPCTCPSKPDPQANWFIVNGADFTICTVAAFMEQNKRDPMCYMRLMTTQRFETRKEAEQAAEAMFDGSVRIMKERLSTLRRKGKTRPWEEQ